MANDTTRREALLFVAAGAGALALAHATRAAAEPPMASHGMDACIAECEKSNRACLEAARYSLEKGGALAAPAHVRLLLDCAELCQLTANFMLRGSEVHAIACGACADVCERCADSCASFTGDAVLSACADACRTCAKSCREMAKM